MAYVNVAEWSPDQVTDWLKGLDNVITPYINLFLKHEVKGQQLLNLRADELEHLGIYTIGHQELILEAVEHLRNFHYDLDRENLQQLALRLSCAARSLYNELLPLEDTTKVLTQTMSDVANINKFIKQLVNWLDRSPFSGQLEYTEKKMKLLKLSIEMSTCAQRDLFAECPVAEIRKICYDLAQLADFIIQDILDPMILQPASLDLATLKKRENDLGFFLVSNFHPVHQISEIKFGSPAHTSGKIEEGDEIVQVNYQTVVGWQRKKVLLLFQESPPDVLLTLKKRPKHTKIYGQIYMKPYRLPSKKRALPYTRWHDNIPSPRPELLTIPDFELPLKAPSQNKERHISDSDSLSSVSDSDTNQQCTRVYPLKPRPVLQRRNTITGASPTSKGPSISIEQFWRELKSQASYKHLSTSFISENEKPEALIRDKSASYGHGLELNHARPSTVIGLSSTNKKCAQENMKLNKEMKLNNNSIKDNLDSTKENKSRKKCVGVHFEDEQVSINKVEEKINLMDSKENKENLFLNSLKFIDEFEDEIQDRSNLINFENKSDQELDDQIEPEEIKQEVFDRGKILDKLINQQNSTIIKSSNIDTNLDFKVDVKSKVSSFENKISKPELPQKPAQPPPTKPRTKLQNHQPESTNEKPPEIPPKPDKSTKKQPAVPPRTDRKPPHLRHLDKSHSTPAYDTSELSVCDSSTPSSGTFDRNFLFTNINHENYKTKMKKMNDKNNNFNDNQNKLLNNANYEVLERCMPPVPPPRPSHTLPNNSGFDSSPIALSTPKIQKVTGDVSNKKCFDFDTKSFDSNGNSTISTPISPISPKTPSLNNDKNKSTSSQSIESLPKPDVSTKLKIDSQSKSRQVPVQLTMKAIISKGKSVKKKNSLLLKRRRVSVKDVEPGDISGYLYQRVRSRTTQAVQWIKRYFVLNNSALYGFATPECQKAECVIFLSEFIISEANEVKSRANAFKVYHQGTAFYFSTDNSETMLLWLESLSAWTNSVTVDSTKSQNLNNLYSETDSNDSDSNESSHSSPQEKHNKKFSSLKKLAKFDDSTSVTSSPCSTTSSSTSSTSLDRKYLKIFNSSSTSSSHTTPSCKKNIPVPTAQFRSYRKLPPPPLTPIETASNLKTNETSTSNFLLNTNLGKTINLSSQPSNDDELQIKEIAKKSESSKKTKPINYIHASNPSLYDFTNDFKPSFIPKKSPILMATSKPTYRLDNLSGCITLEQFMLRRQEEERRLQNIEDDDNKKVENELNNKSEHKKLNESHSYSYKQIESQVDKNVICRKYSDGSSVCKTETSDDNNLDDDNDDHQHLKNEKMQDFEVPNKKITKFFDRRPIFNKKNPINHPPTPKHKNRIVQRQHSLTSADKPRKKYEVQRSKSPDNKFLLSWRNNDKTKSLKSASQYTPMVFPLQSASNEQLNKLSPRFSFDLDENKKSGSKLKSLFSVSNKQPKEKTLLGSPRLHRAIFRGRSSCETPPQILPQSQNFSIHQSSSFNENDWRRVDKEAFYIPPSHSVSTMPISYGQKMVTFGGDSNFEQSSIPPDYPGLEYPPVFEPETYSLTNPNGCSFIRKNKLENI